MKIIRNRFIPFKGFVAINLFGVIFVRGNSIRLTHEMLNHEAIHTAQMRELGYIFFYIIYFFEWLVRLMQKGNAYRSISLEREAYAHAADPDYLSRRKPYAQWRHR